MNRPARTRSGFGQVRVDHHGAAVGDHEGQSAVRLAAFARRNFAKRPYGVVNDYVSLTLGMRMGAPVVPATLVDLGDQPGVVALAFGERGVPPPPADFAELAEEYPDAATAILVLDWLVLNTDRHEENTGHLPRVGVAAWDYDGALFGHLPPVSGIRNLELGMDLPVVGHPIAPLLKDSEPLSYWIRAAAQIPPAAVRGPVYACFDEGLLAAAERDKLYTFIRHRQSALSALIEARFDDFVQMPRPLKL